MELPYEFNQIVDYSSLYNIQSNFVGYTYDSNSDTIKMDIANKDNYNILNNLDELADIMYDAKKTTKDVSQIKGQIDRLEKELKNTNNKFSNGINANKMPIKAGIHGNTVIDSNGIYTFDKDNPKNMIRITHSGIGISKNGIDDFEPIINSDGIINERAIPNLGNIIKDQLEDEVEKIAGTINQNNTIGGNGDGGNTTNQYITNKTINNIGERYENFPCKIYRNKDTKKVEKIEYYKDGVLSYIETYIRKDGKKITSIELQKVNGDTQVTTLERDEDNKVNAIDIQYITNQDDNDMHNENNDSVVNRNG